MGPWVHGSSGRWVQGSINPRVDGSTGGWIHGSLDPRVDMESRLDCFNYNRICCLLTLSWSSQLPLSLSFSLRVGPMCFWTRRKRPCVCVCVCVWGFWVDVGPLRRVLGEHFGTAWNSFPWNQNGHPGKNKQKNIPDPFRLDIVSHGPCRLNWG